MIKINKLILIATRKEGYNDVYGRSYELNMTNGGRDTLENFLANSMVAKRGAINDISVANNLPNLMTMQNGVTHRTNIANGWNTQRLAFIMEVETNMNGTILVSYLQGYSEYHDPSLSGMVDPKVRFHINSIATVTRMIDPVNNIVIARPHSNFNIIKDVFNNVEVQEITDTNLKLIRPSDVISGVNHISVFGAETGMVHDTVSDLSGVATSSNRGNNSPIKHLSKTINTYVNSINEASTNVGYGPTNEDSILSATAENATDSSLLTIPFINALYTFTGVPTPTSFDMDLLSKMDPGIQDKVLLIENSADLVTNMPTSILDTNVTEVHYKPTIESNIANTVAHSISDLLVSNLLATIDFSVTNRMGPPVVAVSNVRSFIEGIDTTSYVNKLATGVEHVLMPEITQNGLLMVELIVHSDLITETTISVSINAAPPVVFRFPTFADSLYVPVITDETNKTLFTDDMGVVLDTVNNVVNSGEYMQQIQV